MIEAGDENPKASKLPKGKARSVKARAWRPGEPLFSAETSDWLDDDPLAEGSRAIESQICEVLKAAEGAGRDRRLLLDDMLEIAKRKNAKRLIEDRVEEARRFFSLAGVDLTEPMSLCELHLRLSDRICAVLHLASALEVEPLDVWEIAKQNYLQDERDAGLRKP